MFRIKKKYLFSNKRNSIAMFIAATSLLAITTSNTNHLKADENDLVFVQNATTGINSVLRSLELHDSDGVLVLSLHYSPILTTLRRTCEYKQEIIDLKELNVSNKLPLPTSSELIELVEQNLIANPHIKIAMFDHITSPLHNFTSEEISGNMCKYDVRVLIDGAHALSKYH